MKRQSKADKLGEALKKLRKDRRIRAGTVAEAVCVHRATYSGWETGRGSPSFIQMVQLADLYQMSLDDIVNLTGIRNK